MEKKKQDVYYFTIFDKKDYCKNDDTPNYGHLKIGQWAEAYLLGCVIIYTDLKGNKTILK